MVLALTDVKRLPADLAGLIVAAGALSWSTAAWLQFRLDGKDRGAGRNKRVMTGIGHDYRRGRGYILSLAISFRIKPE